MLQEQVRFRGGVDSEYFQLINEASSVRFAAARLLPMDTADLRHMAHEDKELKGSNSLHADKAQCEANYCGEAFCCC